MTKNNWKQEVKKITRRVELYFNAVQALEDKIEHDIKIYGKPLGHKVLSDKVDNAKINLLQVMEQSKERIAKTVPKLTKYDQKVLKAIRSNDGGPTSSENNYKFDNRFSGSAKSRWAAKQITRRDKNGNN